MKRSTPFLHYTILLVTLLNVLCTSPKIQEEINSIKIERCKDCIYLSDFHNYEINLGSKLVHFEKFKYYKPLIIKWWTPNGISFPWGSSLHFYLRNDKTDNMNTLVCYLTEEYVPNYDSINHEEMIITKEIYKIFTQDTYLDKEGVHYYPKGNYEELKKYFKRLTIYVPDSLKLRPKNYIEINNTDNHRQDYFKHRQDLLSYRFQNQVYTMTLNRESYNEGEAFNNNDKLYRLRDMAIYVTYTSNIPTYVFLRDNTYTLENLIELSQWNNSTLNQYNELNNDVKNKINIIRKNRGQVAFEILLDSIDKY